MIFRRLSCLGVVFTLLASFASAQSSQPSATTQSATQAQILLGQSATATFGLVAVSDVIITGTVTTHFGVDDSGNFTLQATSTGAAKVQMSLGAGGSRTEFYTPWAADPGCTWMGADSVNHPMAAHNCWTLGSWFFPILPLTQSQSNILVAYVGSETRNSATVNHLVIGRSQISNSNKKDTVVNNLSTGQLYLDAATNLPTAYTYITHPDNDYRTNIPVEIRYSDYRPVNGVNMPFSIQKLMNGTIVLEFSVSSATFNTGFQIQ